jgi:hypothetical protein
MSKKIIGLIIVIIVVVGGYLLFKPAPAESPTIVSTSPSETTTPEDTTPTPTPTPSLPQDDSPLPKSVLIKIPFTAQAPTANWDELHGEACEEASAYMVHRYFNAPESGSATTITPPEFEDGLAKLTDYENKTFGYYLDITGPETARMIEDNYKLRTRLIYDFTEEQIKRALANGHAIIMPFNGRKLGNPNYRQPGPRYHMLVIKGYTETTMITNDPGTRKGLNYPYTFEVLQEAAADWDHSLQDTNSSQKMAIEVWKE